MEWANFYLNGDFLVSQIPLSYVFVQYHKAGTSGWGKQKSLSCTPCKINYLS